MTENLVDLAAIKAEREAALKVVAGGGPPHDPGMEPRVAALERDMKDLKTSLRALELSAVRVEAVLGILATKADMAVTTGSIAVLTQRMDGQDRRLVAVEKSINDTIAVALSKTLGAASIVGMVGGIAVITAALVGVVAWTLRHFALG